MKKGGLILASLLFLISLVSAYGERSGILVGNYYLDLDLIISVGVFMLIFVCVTLATRKLQFFSTEGARIFVSFILALFSVYGLSQANVDYQEIFINIGIANFIMNSIHWILLVFAIIIILIYNVRTLILISSGAFIVMGITGMINDKIIFNWDYSLMFGIILLLFYLWLRKRSGSPGKQPKVIEGSEAKFGLYVNDKTYEDARNAIINVKSEIGKTNTIYILNNGSKILFYQIKNKRNGVKLSKKVGYVKGGKNKPIQVTLTAKDGQPREIAIFARGRNQKWDYARIVLYPTNTPTTKPEPSPLDLQKEYDKCSNAIQAIMKKYNRKIPGQNTTGRVVSRQEKNDSKEYSKLINRMKAIERLARMKGIKLK